MFQKKGLTREELLAQAEQKRKELENKKNLSKYQIIISKVYISFIVRKKIVNGYIDEFEKKYNDIMKLKGMLKEKFPFTEALYPKLYPTLHFALNQKKKLNTKEISCLNNMTILTVSICESGKKMSDNFILLLFEYILFTLKMMNKSIDIEIRNKDLTMKLRELIKIVCKNTAVKINWSDVFEMIYNLLIPHLKYNREYKYKNIFLIFLNSCLCYDDTSLTKSYILFSTEIVILTDKSDCYYNYIRYILSLPFSLSLSSIDLKVLLCNKTYYNNIITTILLHSPVLPSHIYYDSPSSIWLLGNLSLLWNYQSKLNIPFNILFQTLQVIMLYMNYYPATSIVNNYIEIHINRNTSMFVKYPDLFCNQLSFINDINSNIRNLMKNFIPSDFIPAELNDYINSKREQGTIKKIYNYFKSLFSSGDDDNEGDKNNSNGSGLSNETANARNTLANQTNNHTAVITKETINQLEVLAQYLYILFKEYMNDSTRYIPLIKITTFTVPTVPYFLHILTNYISINKSVLPKWKSNKNVIISWEYYMICILSETFRHMLYTIEPNDISTDTTTTILPISQVIEFITFQKDFILFEICDVDPKQYSKETKHILMLFKLFLRSVYDFNPNIVSDSVWSGFNKKIDVIKSYYFTSSPNPISSLIHELPFLIPIKDRLAIFTEYYKVERENNRRLEYTLYIHRNYFFEDGLRSYSQLLKAIKGHIRVLFIAEDGHEEVGVDMGGLFKEYLTELSKNTFTQSYGLFSVTDDNLLYPNPLSDKLFGSNHLDVFKFLGMMLGKAIYEGITIQPQFALFFLRQMLSKPIRLNDLNLMDKQLYDSLNKIKFYEGDIRDLCLTFSMADEGGFIPNGSNIEVTNSNKLQYIREVIIYKLCKQIKPQCDAFLSGLTTVISKDMISMFSAGEFQTLISGSSNVIDLDDLKKNTQYSGGYFPYSSAVRLFWKVMYKLPQNDVLSVIRFVTSCERSPPLGFSQLTPLFTVHYVPLGRGEKRLPTASTCFNMLKLPDYSSEKEMREMLLVAAKSKSGFEMS